VGLKRGFGVCLAVASLLAAWSTGSAQSAFDSSVWSYKTSGCASGGIPIDPISLVEYGYGAYYSQARARLEARTGFVGDNNAAGQWASSLGFCTTMNGQSFTALATCSGCVRYHLRYNQTHEKDTLGRYETVGTPHFEQWRGCGHVVTTFTGGRDYIVNQMSAWYSYSWQWWGNTSPRGQCDGTAVGSDGYTAWVNVG
jgi:hypothetical protein